MSSGDLARARDVLPTAGWVVEEFSGRPLTEDDLPALAGLGVNDAFFAWERSTQEAKYYEGILKFRLQHYAQYGFGVHGVWQGRDLIGQFGLQVLDPDREDIEFVIFLGRQYVGHGIGSRLLEYLISRCSWVGIEEIFGVVRTENSPAIRMMERFNGMPLARKIHFGKDAVIYSIPIPR